MIFPTLEQYARAKGAATRVPRVILPYHRKMYAAITSWAAGTLPGGARNLAITIPPRHGKTLAAHDTVEWLFGMVPESRWLYTAYSADLAVSQTMRIRDALVSDWYRRMFPDTQVRGNRQNFVTTAAGGELYGVGMTGTLTGFGAGRKRREFGGAIVIDDPLSAEESRSATRRAHVNEWYTQTLKSRRNHDGTPILLIMQRLHTEDLVGHVLATEPGLWRVLKLSAMDEATGEMLWPETFSRESAELMREVDPMTFYAQYQQEPMIPGGAMIKKEWWQWFDFDGRYRFDGMLFATADTAYKAKSTADASVIRRGTGHGTPLIVLIAPMGGGNSRNCCTPPSLSMNAGRSGACASSSLRTRRRVPRWSRRCDGRAFPPTGGVRLTSVSRTTRFPACRNRRGWLRAAVSGFPVAPSTRRCWWTRRRGSCRI